MRLKKGRKVATNEDCFCYAKPKAQSKNLDPKPNPSTPMSHPSLLRYANVHNHHQHPSMNFFMGIF